MSSLQEKIQDLFHHQILHWPQARKFYDSLQEVRTRTFSFDGFEVQVQFNPARAASTSAKIDPKSIAERKCFLCAENRPVEQNGIAWGNYTILVNPFPIFPRHFTIPRVEHVDQQIFPFYSDMLALAKELSDFVIFYNGPECGASAPDHMHFQAGDKNYLPLITDYFRLKATHTEVMESGNNYRIVEMKNYLRTVICIESDNEQASLAAFENIYRQLQQHDSKEPLMNIVCCIVNNSWHTFILPRKAFRPWQFNATDEQQLMISPATVEMCGILITPVEKHFEKIEQQDIESIFEQITLPNTVKF